MSSELIDAIVDMREHDALAIVRSELDAGVRPAAVLDDAKQAMEVIGEAFSCGKAYIPELIMAGEIMKGISAELKPRLASSEVARERLGIVVLCTAEGDIHDIGKDIVATMLDIAGFEVVDLGVDVPAATVVERVREVHPQVVGLSALLTVAFESMKATVAALDDAGLRADVKIMLGGAPVTADVCAFAGADGWGKDAVEAVGLARSWVGGA